MMTVGLGRVVRVCECLLFAWNGVEIECVLCESECVCVFGPGDDVLTCLLFLTLPNPKSQTLNPKS